MSTSSGSMASPGFPTARDMREDAGYAPAAERLARRATGTGGPRTFEALDTHIRELNGKHNELRTQLRQLNTKLNRLPQMSESNFLEEAKREMTALRQEAGGMRQELAQAKQAISQTVGLREEIERLQRTMTSELQRVRAEAATFPTALQEEGRHIAALRDEVARMRADMGLLSAAREELRSTRDEAHRLRDDMEDQAYKMHMEVRRMQDELERARRGTDQTKEELRQRAQNAESDVSRLRSDLRRMNDEVHGTLKTHAEKHHKFDQDIAHVKKNNRGSPDLEKHVHSLKNDMGVTTTEFKDLKNKLEELGVLKPPKVEVAEDEHPPVGTIEMGEDCFTARLLIKLGYAKLAQIPVDSEGEDMREVGRVGQLRLAGGEESDECSESSVSSPHLELTDAMETVTGLVEPDIAIGDRGYWAVTSGVAILCQITLFLQILIVSVLYYYAQTPTECLDHELPHLEHMVLHASKGMAIFVAGSLMAKDLMDIVNALMVSVLLEVRCNKEVAWTCFARTMLSVLIAVAQLHMFRGMVSPASVWINMAALAFINELGAAVTDQGKKGVFGRHIRMSLTNLNYNLTFSSEYPWWFPACQYTTLSLLALMVLWFSYLAYTASDPVC